MKFGLPFLPPICAQSTRYDHPQQGNQAEVWPFGSAFARWGRQHSFDPMREKFWVRALFGVEVVRAVGSVSRLRRGPRVRRGLVHSTCAEGEVQTERCFVFPIWR